MLRCRFEPTSWQVVKGRILAEAAHLSEACEQFAYEPSYSQWSSQQVRWSHIFQLAVAVCS